MSILNVMYLQFVRVQTFGVAHGGFLNREPDYVSQNIYIIMTMSIKLFPFKWSDKCCSNKCRAKVLPLNMLNRMSSAGRYIQIGCASHAKCVDPSRW